MSYWILPASAYPLSCTTVQRVTEIEKKTDEFQEKMKQFNEKVNFRIGNHVKSADIPNYELSKVLPEFLLDLEHEDDAFHNEFHKAISDPSLKDADDMYDNEYGKDDPYLGMKLRLPRGPDDELQHAKVKKRDVDNYGKPMGKANNNP